MLTKAFEKELESLLNKHSIDSLCGTPDFILSEFLCKFLDTYQKTQRSNDRWHGRMDLNKVTEEIAKPSKEA